MCHILDLSQSFHLIVFHVSICNIDGDMPTLLIYIKIGGTVAMHTAY